MANRPRSDVGPWTDRFVIIEPDLYRLVASMTANRVVQQVDGFARACDALVDQARLGIRADGRRYEPDAIPRVVVIDKRTWLPHPAINAALRGAGRARSTVRKHAQALCRFVHAMDSTIGRLEATTADDIEDFAALRQESATDWSAEEDQLFEFVDLLTREPYCLFGAVSPWPARGLPDGTRTVGLARAPLGAPGKVRILWLPDWRLVCDVGVVHREDSDVPSSLFPARDLAVLSLLLASGVRFEELLLVLIPEVPAVHEVEFGLPWPSYSMQIGQLRAKREGGLVPLTQRAIVAFSQWVASPAFQRLVHRAQPSLEGLVAAGAAFVVDDWQRDADGVVRYKGRWRGAPYSPTTHGLRPEAARLAVMRDGDIWRPLSPWIGNNGGHPLSDTRMKDVVFGAINARIREYVDEGLCAHTDTTLVSESMTPTGPKTRTRPITPNMTRHTAAVSWMVTLRQLKNEPQDNAERRPSLLPLRVGINPEQKVTEWLRHLTTATLKHYQTFAHGPTHTGAGTIAPSVSDLELGLP